MNISPISTKNDIKEFHQIPFMVNKNNKNWIPHIKQDVENVFNQVFLNFLLELSLFC